jgi:hypothetical protein
MDREYCTDGADEKCVQIYGREPEENYHLDDLIVEGNIILNWILKKQDIVCELDSCG